MSRLIGIVMSHDEKHNLVVDKSLNEKYSAYGTVVGISPYSASSKSNDDLLALDVLVLPTTGTVNNGIFGKAPSNELDYKKFTGYEIALYTQLLPKYMQTETAIIAGGVSFFAICALEGCTLDILVKDENDKSPLGYVSFCEDKFNMKSGAIKNMNVYRTTMLDVVQYETDNVMESASSSDIPNMNNYNCMLCLDYEYKPLKDVNGVRAYPLAMYHKSKPIITGFILPETDAIFAYLQDEFNI